MNTTENQPLPVWQPRAGMGASPLAIETAEQIAQHLQPFLCFNPSRNVALIVDGALRKAGCAEMLAALTDIAEGNIRDTGRNALGYVRIDAEDMRRIARAAISKATDSR